MRGSVKPHGRLVVWALPAVMRDSKFGYIGGHPGVTPGQYRGNLGNQRVRRDYTPKSDVSSDMI